MGILVTAVFLWAAVGGNSPSPPRLVLCMFVRFRRVGHSVCSDASTRAASSQCSGEDVRHRHACLCVYVLVS